MSMHKKPLTQLEEDGLRAHGLDIGTPSQLSDAFRHGVAWALTAGMEQSAKLCDERAAYYEGDDDGPEGRRNLACKACADVIRYHVANKVKP